MRALNSQKMTNEALSVASDVLKKLGVEALWLTQKNEVPKFREKIRKLVNKQTCKRLAALSQISDERKLKVRQAIFCIVFISSCCNHMSISSSLSPMSLGHQNLLLATYRNLRN